ncbi:glycogen debranching protein GlgX [Aestuariicoccus sp. MJ-SS9]|uniref:glycogen debranching protein GlgX n=1 Tax=Aestuariicoccus sp. MJ-SS9 TaxID=3079855 RepID=UPI002910FC34|nr:glycogen debranching protein GlgX [Aestuariicoccus sp. MJ-SS9]MDU8910654.1 glycogen debranching protein GlgX [Aestuariicoccus sp. MJ-SS9]
MSQSYAILAGRPAPLGASFQGDGVNFAVFSKHATGVTLCLFDGDGAETQIPLPEWDGDVWHGFVPGLTPGQHYGYRVEGTYAPHEGHRFNPAKLLIDPYAKRLTGHPIWHDALYGGDAKTPDKRDSAPYMPRSVVEDPAFDWGDIPPPGHAMESSILYEAHVKGLTQTLPGVDHPGGFLGIASDAVLEHLTGLGVTAIELLPVQAFLNDRFLVEKGLVNYWGYQTLGFFAPDSRYLTQHSIWEFQHMVARLHSAGIEVILDVVYNHSCEGDHTGPTLSFRGLDNASYYRLAGDRSLYINDTGTGNTLNMDHPMVLRMVMDSLRYWADTMGVDGFRFDLCATLGRTEAGFDRNNAFFNAVRQDPVLAGKKLIAEPWDIGPGGYKLGAFPPPFSEWNDQFRDGVRRFWRGDPGHVPILADRITGSAHQFDHSGRPATSSVNLITAHDGYTMADMVAYKKRHNQANGEENRDGHGENYSDNFGVEGPTDDPEITAARIQRRRNLMATLLLAQGTPMILGGDEIGNGQKGNNNAYAQDNRIGWIGWDKADSEFLEFAKKVIAFRHAHPILRQKRFLHSQPREADGLADLFWWRADGREMARADWTNGDLHLLCAEMRMASGTPDYAEREDALYLAFNAGDEVTLTLPVPQAGFRWVRHLDSADPEAAPRRAKRREPMSAHSVLAFVLEPEGAA